MTWVIFIQLMMKGTQSIHGEKKITICIFTIFHFPIQKSLNITSNISSEDTFPVMLPIYLSALRKHWAANTISLFSI